jgi:serine/threonine protein kinase/WD40 repeat protein
MDPEHFQRLMGLFDELSELAPAERGPRLEAALAAQPSMTPEFRQELEALLAEHDSAGRVATAGGAEALGLDSAPLTSPIIFSSPSEALPVLKGAYRLLRTLGEGGMGIVYEAEQAFPRRRVAIKALRGTLATPGMLRRFRNEVELLARLHHPGIAQIFEAGFADENSPDQAFFVMELVEGVSLTRYAKERTLSVQDRLTLLLKVCEAVEHAHQRGVIHRDLKPGNILVTSVGQPKILDFGVARTVDHDADATMATRAGQVIGTPSYMSPEQIEGDPGLDTRTDVYALGVIAYELLTGKLPFDFSTTPIAEAARILQARHATPLTLHSRALAGDTEVVVATAMHRDRDRRYQSAAAMAEDLRRLIAGLPIAARRDSPAYVLSKLARRHWPQVSLGALLLTSLLVFGITSGLLARRNAALARESDAARLDAEKMGLEASSQRDIAQTQRDAAKQASQRLEAELSLADIERARLEALLGRLSIAEDRLWDSYLNGASPDAARWALWDLYHRIPCLSTAALPERPTAMFVPPGSSNIIAGTSGGDIAFIDPATAAQIRRLDLGNSAIYGIRPIADASRLVVWSADGHIVVTPADGSTPATPLGEGRPHGRRASIVVDTSADGSTLATAGSDGFVRLWDASTLALKAQWKAESRVIAAIAISPDASRVATIDNTNDAKVNVWNTADTSAPLLSHARPRPFPVYMLAFGVTTDELIFGSLDRTATRLSISDRTESPIIAPFTGPVRLYVPSPDGSSVLIAGGDALFVMGTPTPTTTLTTPTTPVAPVTPIRLIARHRRNVYAAGWKDNHTVVTVTNDGLIRTFSTKVDPALRRLGGFDSWCFGAAYAPDGSRIAIGSGDGTVAIFDAATLERTGVVANESRTFRTRAVCFLRDSTTLLAGGMDGRVRVINANNATITHELGQASSEIYCIAVNADESLMAVGNGEGFVRVWDLSTMTPLRTLAAVERRVEGVAFAKDGTTVVAGGGRAGLRAYNARTGAVVANIPMRDMPWAVAFSPDGASLLASTYAGTVERFDWPAMTPRDVITAHQVLIPALSFSADGRLFATGSEDGAVRLWDAHSARLLLTLEPDASEVVTTVFDPTSRFLVAATSLRFTGVYDLKAMDPFIAGNRAYHEARLRPPAAEPSGTPTPPATPVKPGSPVTAQ